MDAFGLRDRVVSDYEQYVRSFFHIRNQRIRDLVDEEVRSGKLWPEPLIQLNPAFAPGGTVAQLVQEKVLHERCATIFRSGKEGGCVGKARHMLADPPFTLAKIVKDRGSGNGMRNVAISQIEAVPPTVFVVHSTAVDRSFSKMMQRRHGLDRASPQSPLEVDIPGG
jgi:hypothetical protein